MKNEYVAEKIPANSEAESKRLTSLAQEKLDIARASNFTAEIEKLTSKRKLQGDRQVFKNDEEFKQAGLEILKKYNASDSEENWFLGIVAKSPFPK